MEIRYCFPNAHAGEDLLQILLAFGCSGIDGIYSAVFKDFFCTTAGLIYH